MRLLRQLVQGAALGAQVVLERSGYLEPRVAADLGPTIAAQVARGAYDNDLLALLRKYDAPRQSSQLPPELRLTANLLHNAAQWCVGKRQAQ